VSPIKNTGVTTLPDALVEAGPHVGSYVTLDVAESGMPALRFDDIVVSIEDIDPTLAEYWLSEYNTHNRSLAAETSAGHARDQRTGDWLFIGDTIRFAKNPDDTVYLADGQHRLDAIRRSGITQRYIVVRGLGVDAQEAIDTNRVRSFAATLRLNGHFNELVLAAITRRLYLHMMQGRGAKGGGARNPTKAELSRFLTEHEHLIKEACSVASLATNAQPKIGKPATLIGSLWLLFAQKDREAADLFVREMLVKGNGLDDGHPVQRLRIRYARTDKNAIDDNEAFMLGIKAWNHWRRGEKIGALIAPRDGWPSNRNEYEAL
jgi:hypothetical protein